MEWQGGRRGGGVEDRRGMGGGTLAGGGIVGLLIAAGAYFFFGVDPSTTQQVVSQFGGAGQQEAGRVGTPEDQAGQFVDVVGTNINDVWKTRVEGYQAPVTVLYDQGTSTGCGFGQAAMGPFYCPNDHKVYLDLSFWSELERLGGSGGDFAKAYVLAHEFGHHVQTYTGASDRTQRAAGGPDQNRYSVALELQADCYAGVWAKNAAAASGGKVTVDQNDLEQGLQTASAIGDDKLTQGRVSPDNFTHGSSAERVEWLRRGYQSGDPNACDTFAGV